MTVLSYGLLFSEWREERVSSFLNFTVHMFESINEGIAVGTIPIT